MTTIHDAVPPRMYRPQANPSPVTLRRVLGSEWVKLRSLRSSWITFFLAVAGMVIVAIVGGVLTDQDWDHLHPGELALFDPVSQSLTGINFSQLAIGVLGLLFVTGEYGSGMIRSHRPQHPDAYRSCAPQRSCSRPSRWCRWRSRPSRPFSPAKPRSAPTTLAAAGALRATVGTGLYLTVVALLGISLGFVIRSTAGGIAALFGILLVLPGVLATLPETWQTSIGPYLPSNAGAALYDLHPETASLAPWTGFAVFCLYAAVAMVAAALVLTRRDA